MYPHGRRTHPHYGMINIGDKLYDDSDTTTPPILRQYSAIPCVRVIYIM
jgi:hypothetical protein